MDMITSSPSLSVIGAGMPRTGTMSLKAALERLGYGRCYHMVDLMQDLSKVPDWLAADRGEPVDWHTLFAGYQAVVDIPGQRYYQELMRVYPAAKVILSTRDPARWYDSVKQTIYQAHTLNEVGNSWWWLRYPLSQQRRNKVLLGGLIGKILWEDYFHGRFEDKDYVISVYENHLKAVREYVPENNLLIFDVAEGWQPLCRFLDVPFPQHETFPHVNDREQFREFWQLQDANTPDKAHAIVTIAQQVGRHSKESPDEISLICQDTSVTHQQLQDNIRQITSRLQQLELSLGDRIVLYLPNCTAFVISYLAAQQIGAVTITLNTALTSPEIQHILDDSQACLVITTHVLQPHINRDNHPGLKHILLIDSPPGTPESAYAHTESTAPLQPASLSTDDPAVILYSSGTTGRPKGAVLSHGNLLSSARRISAQLELDTDDRVLIFLPLFHCYALTTMLNPALYRKARIIILPEFESRALLQAVSEHRITTLFAVPTIYNLLSQQEIPTESFHSVRHCLSAGAPLPAGVARRWQDKFGVPLTDGLGFTEGSHVTLNPNPLEKPGSVGLPLPGIEIRVIDENDQHCEPDVPGEIIVRGSNIMLGYWNETEQALKDSWFYTGDIGRLDADGYLYVVDRRKDMVSVGGEKVYPTEVEQVLYTHPAVAEAAVYGIPHPQLGEEVRAGIVLKDHSDVTEADISAFCRERLAHFKLPGRIEFTASLPKNKTGKILKRVLRERFTTSAQTHTDQIPLKQALRQATPAARICLLIPYLKTEIQQLTGHISEDDQNVFALGFDSLQSIQLANRLATGLGLELPSTIIIEYPVIQQLAAHLSSLYQHGASGEATPDTHQPVSWDIHDWFPQSYIQQLYFGWHEAAVNKSFMNMNFVVRVCSEINTDDLRTAVQMLLDRHADLRLIYERRDGIAMQKVRQHQPAFFVEQAVTVENWEEARPDILAASRQAFDLRNDPTMRVYLFSRNPEDHILLIVRHHIINDRTTAALTLDELFTLYQALRKGMEVPVITTPTYFEFMQWHGEMLESAEGLQHLQYWEKQLAKPLELLALPTDYPRHPKNRHFGDVVNFQLSKTITSALRQLASENGVTLYALMLTAFKLLLHFHTGQRDILVDTSMINRTRQQFEKTVGQLSIIHTLRTSIPLQSNFPDLLKTVQQTVREAITHQTYPSQLLIERLQLPEAYVYNRPGQVLFNLVTADSQVSLAELGKGELVLMPTDIIPSGSAGTFHEINTQLLEQDGKITGHINYETDLYKKSTIRKLMLRYENILQQLVITPQQSIAELRMAYEQSPPQQIEV